MGDVIPVAVSALEVLLFDLLGCQPGDEIKIMTEMDGEAADALMISAITVTRGEGKVFFMAAEPLVLQGTLYLVGSYFLTAATNFVLEVVQPAYRHHLHSVSKLMAFAKEVNLEAEFDKEAYRLQQKKAHSGIVK